MSKIETQVTAAKAPKRRTRSKTRHAEILDEAARVFNRRGVSLTAFREVSEALGVSRRALYHYVADREDLVFQCYRRTCQTLDRRLGEAIEGGGGALAVVDRFLDLTLGPDQPQLCAITEPGLLLSQQRAEVTRLHDGVAHRLAAVLDEGHAAGEVRKCDTGVIAQSILGLVIWLPVSIQWSTGQVQATPAESLAFAKSFVRDGWAADRSHVPDFPVQDLSTFAVPVVEAFDRVALAEAKREKILATASRLFNRKGIDSTSMEEIAGELGATPRAVYHHVGDKSQLVAECYLRTLHIAMALQRVLQTRAATRLQATLAFQEAWSLALMRPDVSPLLPLAGFEALTAEAKTAFMTQVHELTETALWALATGMQEGSIRNLDRRATRLNTGVFGWLTRGEVVDPAAQKATAREIAAFHALGIRALS